ncbi:tyrosine--tRNA ligase [Mycoplasma putrefaciens]|uniref:Tyrosine--tRNA ligase n=1 Tax=Mycoplasma putrefaciens (strain ATCC 15718 / NCTC 10155 / C30 KS-1 / KS-1) TaxID=743965 RepID=A0A7U3ZS91_MYCPK|nr:tyrosine--tRNA ligase [Mycoplasma putrefaciens]AEM68587.1 tyrosyl-tRNA synthetase [Mycoplasma putrefaciens KS1]
MKHNIIDELTWRGLVKQITNQEKIILAQNNHQSVYCGFDPTADSLHVGHLMMIVTLKRFGLLGFKPIALIGGATGMIGDPSFKSTERVLQTDEQVLKNIKAISKQLTGIISDVKFVNNADWLKPISLIEFLREVAKHFNLSYLLAKESIASRIQTGLSITEFSYTMLQAYDFYHLYTKHNCTVQIGGSDQWGNITSGIDFITDKLGKENSKAAGFTIPLLVKSDGQKFGKTESGAIWLDASKTSEYEFYQFWFNQADDDCEKMLKLLTFLSESEINNLVEQHKLAPQKHIMQKALAEEITKFVHKQTGLQKAQRLTEAFFTGKLSSLTSDLLKTALSSLKSIELEKDVKIIDALIRVSAATSKREAREFINAKAIYVNDQLITDENQLLESFDLLEQKYLLIKKGKRKYFLITLK